MDARAHLALARTLRITPWTRTRAVRVRVGAGLWFFNENVTNEFSRVVGPNPNQLWRLNCYLKPRIEEQREIISL